MRDTHRRVVEITSDNPRTVEQIVHQLRKEAQNAERYGEQVEIRRVDVADKDVEGFTDE
jgi:ribosomal protein S10